MILLVANGVLDARVNAGGGLILAEGDPMPPLTRSIERMGRLVAARLKEALDASGLLTAVRWIDIVSRLPARFSITVFDSSSVSCSCSKWATSSRVSR